MHPFWKWKNKLHFGYRRCVDQQIQRCSFLMLIGATHHRNTEMAYYRVLWMNLSKVNGCWTELKHFWPNVGKAKIRLRGGRSFQFLKNCLHFSAVCLQFFKWIAVSQTHFGFANIGSKMHRFSTTAIYFWEFSIRFPPVAKIALILIYHEISFTKSLGLVWMLLL